MCGIVGYINCKSSFDLTSIGHRGPDSGGVFRHNNVVLGHTRLSIQDVTNLSDQPFVSRDGRYVLIFNGEIYNHLELRLELIKCGKTEFLTVGDTETVLLSLINWGEIALEKFNGIFALAFFDTITGKLLIARDRFGVKPLYYGFAESSFVFGSEIKSLLGWEHFGNELNINVLEHYLRFLWSPGEGTPIKSVLKLLPGQKISFNVSENEILEIKKNFYWDINKEIAFLDCTENVIIDKLDGLLRNAVQRQLLSDVPVGFFLSGGLDSSLLVAIAKDLYPDKKLTCFTIDSSEFASDEGFSNDLFYAKKVADFLDVELEIVSGSRHILDNFDAMIWHLDEPQADAAPLNVFEISRKARELGFKVLIGGTAGDDLFSGYRRHLAFNLIKKFNFIPSILPRVLLNCITCIPVSKSTKRRIERLLVSMSERGVYRVLSLFEWLPYKYSRKLFIKSLGKGDRFKEHKKLLPAGKLKDYSLNDLLTLELRTFLVDHNLNYTDKMGMAAGVEIRVPYLDNDLVDFARSLPDDFKLRNGELKYVLKKVAERYLPLDVIYRSKSGFAGPVRKWINHDLSSRIDICLSEDRLLRQGLFNYEHISKLIRHHRKGGIDVSYTIWALLAIQSWIEQFHEKNDSINSKFR